MAAIPAGWPPGHPNHQVRGLSGWLEKRPSSEKDGKSTPMQWKLRWVVLSPVSFTSEGEFATITWFEKDTLKGGPKGSMKLQLGSVVEPGEDEGEFVVHSADGTQSLRMRAVRKGFDEGSENAPKPAAEWISATMAVRAPHGPDSLLRRKLITLPTCALRRCSKPSSLWPTSANVSH